ncbi:hypothetical protein BBO99_00000839 [Phytophthora kernoviae]|uniref:GPN-loop GTPase 3 n=1 Tax=Phytophthora kernoviae TaxID=325452 RepID=A0A421H1L7_9STRA|nr:hypothetical protein JM16_000664 [Phytophthora kernoviae]RLN85064.1 hypothetical protein BBO99_00000839 [Phytophthora kernoviae]
MRCCQMVMGPAGTGKSTYCNNMHEFCAASGRMTYVVNLDPAADNFEYPVAFDIRDLISVEDVMEELGYGPNGGLIYCMEYLVQNLDWLQDLLGEYGDEDYFIFDCPGQIELYSHLPVMKQLCDSLKDWGFNICGVYLVSLILCDAQLRTCLQVLTLGLFISGVLCSLSAMVQLELPHINVLTKCDLVEEKEMSKYLDPSEGYLLDNLANSTDPKWRPLSSAICNVINDFSMVAFVPMNINKEESIETVLMHVDHAINYGEDLEPQSRRFLPGFTLHFTPAYFNFLDFCNLKFAMLSSKPLQLLAAILLMAMALYSSSVTADIDAVINENATNTTNSTARYLEEEASTDYHILMLNAVNKQRTSRGLPKLCMNKKLQDAALAHSTDMARKNFMGHRGSDGSTMSSRISAAKFKWKSVAENVAAGQSSVKAVMASWMASSGHRANILSTKHKMFNCAYAYNPKSSYKHYWTQDFATGIGEACQQY